MEDIITLTTFNSLNNPERKEERVEVLFQELKEHGTDIVLLQEVLEGTLPLIKEKACQDGWFVSEGSRVAHSTAKVFGNITVSRIPIQGEASLPCFNCEATEKAHVETLITHFENNITTINAHLPWGPTSEPLRLEKAYRINQYAERLQDEEPGRVIVLGGDFNTPLTSSTVRYLKAEFPYLNTSTFWTSAWDLADEIFSTARKEGGWAEKTALGVGITKPEQLPERTIDHLLTYGWVYGKKGCPVGAKRFGLSTLSNGFALSDHYGITVQMTV